MAEAIRKEETPKYTIEIATANFACTAAAVQGGADRIELCSALNEGGLTPSYAYLLHCRRSFSIPIFPIIRPRGGDFLYNEDEFEIIKKDVLFCREAKFEEVVVGFLTQDGRVDKVRIAKVLELAYPLPVTFHRAFDRCRDAFEALGDIIKCGCSRILTSGQQIKAPDGTELIKKLIDTAAGRIVIMPGSGVRKENIAALASNTGATEFHSSLVTNKASKMNFIHPAFAGELGDYSDQTIDPQEVKALRAALATV